MAPRLGSRTYGAVDELSKPNLLPRVDEDRVQDYSGDGDREPVSVQASSAAVTDKSPSHKKWLLPALGCALAVTAVAALLRAGTRVPSSSLKVVNDPSREKPTTNLVATVPAPEGQGSAPLQQEQEWERGSGASDDSSVRDAEAGSKPLTFTALNFYHIRDGKPGQDYPWLKDLKLVEPHRETTLAVTNPQEGHNYTWRVIGGDEAGATQFEIGGVEATALFTRLDENVIILEERNPDGVLSRTLEEKVMVKYVRREIRTLSDTERVELMDSMAKIWDVRVKDGNGKEIYGDDYADIWAINRLHFKAATPKDCDHFHDGLGFLTNHALLSNIFEYSLQRVNPKLTLPYWDFTFESSTKGGAGGDNHEPQASSIVLTPSFFGSHDPMDMQVKDGRWAFTEIPRMVSNNPANLYTDVYSKLRAPWNVNNRAYLTRSLGDICGFRVQDAYPWPTCEMHYQLATEFTDFYSWVWNSAYDPHGPVHVWLGGVLDCEDTYRGIADLVGEDAARKLSFISFVHRKNLFRDGIFKCEGSVGVEETPDKVLQSGVCGCLDYDLTQGDDYKVVMENIAKISQYVGDQDDDVIRKVVALICNGVMNDGDHLQASSSLDPSFWPTHPTMERLWMYTLLTGKVTDTEWPDSDVSYTGSDGTEYVEQISIYGEECMGHRGSDVFPFGLLKGDLSDFRVHTGIKGNVEEGNVLTNRELLKAFDPRVNRLPYVYDTFKWDHCEADGFNMNDAWFTPDGDEAQHVNAGDGVLGDSTTSDRSEVEGITVSHGTRVVFQASESRYPKYSKLTEAD